MKERRWLFATILLAILARLPLLLTPGYDVRGYKVWARGVWEVGLGRAYAQPFPDPGGPYHYSPLFLYSLRVVGIVYSALRPDGTWEDQLLATLIKLPASMAELLLGLLIWRFLCARVGARVALGATAAYLLNPALIWNTAYWGSIDILHALPTLAALIATEFGASGAAGALAALALGSKLTALPGLLALTPPFLRAPRRLLWAIVGALCTLGVLILPIIVQGQIGSLIRALFGNVGLYPAASANAHNLWWLVTGGQGTRPDTTILFAGVDYRRAGFLLFTLFTVGIGIRLWRQGADLALPFVASALLSFAFCMLTTEVHENWFYPLFAPLLIAAALDRRYRALYLAVSLTFLANLALHDPPLFALLGDGILAPARALRMLNTIAQCAILLWWTWGFFRPSSTWKNPRAQI